MSNRFFWVILGLMLSLFGVHICIHGGYYDFKYGINVSFGPDHFYAGIILSIIGLVFLVFAVVKKTEYFEDPEDIYLICPKCLEPFVERKVSGNKCSNCSVDLEEIEGFYDRHPELQETPKDITLIRPPSVKKKHHSINEENNLFFRSDI